MDCYKAIMFGLLLGFLAMGFSGNFGSNNERFYSGPNDDGVQPIEEKFEGGVKMYEHGETAYFQSLYSHRDR